MFLVHIEVQHPEHTALPALAADEALGESGVEHAGVHLGAGPRPVLALYVRAESAAAAALLATHCWARLTGAVELAGWTVAAIRVHRPQESTGLGPGP
ncbi:hypothetical protein ACEZCY_13810 [Streptacidiphilus sp. N1-12]|uniref:Uncharacterized protein n=2 Tax=Streptacidiphilus alkalitolerans TaxID=3342712 RepID=A0ABV6WE26_9ACTN